MSDTRVPSCCSVVELRQYTMQPGRRDVLIELFEREFIETQEAAGMHVIGHFRDLDRPDMYVWLRGFAGMERRREALSDFYTGPTWREHRDAANATLIDSDDVLLLRPPIEAASLAHPPAARPPIGSVDGGPASDAVFEVTIHPVAAVADIPSTGASGVSAASRFAAIYESTAVPVLADLGLRPLAWYVTEDAENSYPRLPIRLGEQVLVTLTRFDDAGAQADAARRRAADARWADAVEPAFERYLAGPPQTLRLSPASRSQLR